MDVRKEHALLEQLRASGETLTYTVWFDDDGDVGAFLLLVDDPEQAEVLLAWAEDPEGGGNVDGAVDHAGSGDPSYTCKRCGFVSRTGAGLAAHQRSTGHKGRV